MKLTTVLLLFLFCLPLLVGLNASSLWDSNEAFYAQTPREMLQRGDWLIPYFNGRPRLNKPPLAYWVVGAFYRVFGVSVFWERFPMALLSIGTLLTTFALGRFLFNETAALLGAGVLATSFRFLILSRRLMIDILLLLCLTAALAFFLIWLKSGRRWAFLGTALALGLGFLTKGPVIGVAVLSILAIVLVQGKFKQLRGAPWTAAVMLIVLLVPAWFLLVAAEVGWDPVGAFFLRENLGRFSHLDFGPQRGVFYYLGVISVDFFPWSLLALASLFTWLRHRRKGWRGQPETGLLVWVGVWLAVFSLSHNKQEYYILPIYPALALWLGYQVQQARINRWWWVLAGILLCLIGLATGLLATDLFSDIAWPYLWLAPFLLLGFPLAAWRQSWMVCILSLSLSLAVVFCFYLPPLEAYRPTRDFARIIQRQGGAAGQAGYFGFTAPSLVFYLNRPIHELQDLQQAATLLDRLPSLFLVIREEDWAPLQQRTGRRLRIVATRPQLRLNSGLLMKGLRSSDRARPSLWASRVYLIHNGENSDESAPLASRSLSMRPLMLQYAGGLSRQPEAGRSPAQRDGVIPLALQEGRFKKIRRHEHGRNTLIPPEQWGGGSYFTQPTRCPGMTRLTSSNKPTTTIASRSNPVDMPWDVPRLGKRKAPPAANIATEHKIAHHVQV